MRKALSALLLMAAPAFALTACNSQSAGVTTMPGVQPNARAGAYGKHRAHDFSSADLHAGGATFPAYAYNLGNQPTGAFNGPQEPPGTGSLFALAPTTGTIYYCLTGSGFGRAVYTSDGAEKGVANATTQACAPIGASPTGFGGRQDPPDFAGSDQALLAADYTSYYLPDREGGTAGSGQGEPFEFPSVGGAITYAYRPKELGKAFPNGMKLSTWTFCAIANGTVASWNDPAIAADNGVKADKLPNQPITFYFRSDGSGTSFYTTNYLSTACTSSWKAPYDGAPYQGSGRSAAWTFGANQTWPGPGSATDPNSRFIGESGNPGVLAAIQSTPYSTGYVEGAWAASANPTVDVPSVQSGVYASGADKGKPIFVNALSDPKSIHKSIDKLVARDITYGGSGDVPSETIPTTRPDCIIFVNPDHFQKQPAGAYPIVAISYLLFYQKNNAHYADDKTIVNYVTGAKTTASETAYQATLKLGYFPLSKSLHTAIQNALNGTGHSSKPCLNP
ncbi:MAG TPA: substrate-binding domain-containing protein [Candidatus Acidoferrales bacterium]|nr:substrate-binding domain-containing protein [Candidatus Acidoferrales bacterium]